MVYEPEVHIAIGENRRRWINSIKEYLPEELEDLFRALALTESFSFYPLVCEGPEVTEAIVRLLPDSVQTFRGRRIQLIYLNPYKLPLWRRILGQRVDAKWLVRTVMGRLVAPAPREKSPDAVWIIDASAAQGQDVSMWSELFARMNEQRNVVRDELRGSLLLCLTPPLERTFAQSAPDFWSIRSFTTVLRGVDPVLVPSGTDVTDPLVRVLTRRPARIVYLAHEADVNSLDRLRKLLSVAASRGQIVDWSPFDVAVGSNAREEVDRHLQEADVIVLLIGTRFLAERSELMERVLESHKTGKARVIAVMLEHSIWKTMKGYNEHESLPRDGLPIRAHKDRDAAWLEVAKGIIRIVEGSPNYSVSKTTIP